MTTITFEPITFEPITFEPITFEPITFERAYYTDDGLHLTQPAKNVVIEGTNLVAHIQTADCAKVYIVLNKRYNSMEEIVKCTKSEIFAKVKAGEFDIGTATMPNLDNILHIWPFGSPNNDEIKLHYTQPREYPGNIAWRSIKWDVFA
jgi:hypothetical protein